MTTMMIIVAKDSLSAFTITVIMQHARNEQQLFFSLPAQRSFNEFWNKDKQNGYYKKQIYIPSRPVKESITTHTRKYRYTHVYTAV